jgi:hypothetical protein
MDGWIHCTWTLDTGHWTHTQLALGLRLGFGDGNPGVSQSHMLMP